MVYTWPVSELVFKDASALLLCIVLCRAFFSVLGELGGLSSLLDEQTVFSGIPREPANTGFLLDAQYRQLPPCTGGRADISLNP